MINAKMTVSYLVNYLKIKLDSDSKLSSIVVSGEISNFTKHRSNHLYFTLKDTNSRINCVMFSSNASKLNFVPKDGDKVLLHASVSIFESSGQIQLYVKAIKLDGVGDLYAKYQQLKRKLYEEGLFNQEHKKAIQKYPKAIAIICGKDSAAYHDILKTLTSRWPLAKLYFIPSLVQGENASKMLITTLKKADSLNVDTIILARGGGSLEDLWAFNNEELAYEIYKCKTPIITGVGHESDTTIVDYVSDYRAATPTAAAVYATLNMEDVKGELDFTKSRLIDSIQTYVDYYADTLNKINNSIVYINNYHIIQNPILKVQYEKQKLLNYATKLSKRREILEKNNMRMKLNLLNSLNNKTHSLSILRNSLLSNVNKKMTTTSFEFGRQIELLDAFSPLKILKRGYNISYKDEKVINSVKDIKKGDEIINKYSDGIAILKVKELKNEDI